jgi:DNA-binding NtrC family response regulator
MVDKSALSALVVDDEEVIRAFLKRFLSMEGFEVSEAEDGYKAIELSKEGQFDAVFLDIRMPKLDGLETLKRLKIISPDSIYVMMSGYSVGTALEDTNKEGAHAALKKPFEMENLKSEIDHIKKIKGA